MIIDSQVHAYDANTPQRPWRTRPHGWPDECNGEQMVAAMDKVGVDGAIFVSAYGLYGYDDSYVKMVLRYHPGRFGMFVNLPLPDVDGSLAEIEYGMDQLKADGVCLMTNIGDRWLGDEHYAPVFAELDRRKAIIYTHPIAPNCCQIGRAHV